MRIQRILALDWAQIESHFCLLYGPTTMSSESPAELFVPFLADNPELPQYQRLFRAFQQAILQGDLALGAKLPASRSLCQALRISRNTVKSAYEMLQAEGYIETRKGAGSFVSQKLPDQNPQQQNASTPQRISLETPPVSPSRLVQQLQQQQVMQASAWDALLTPVRPCTESFPWQDWQRAIVQAGRMMRHASTHTNLGLMSLRTQIADYLKVTRGTQCEPEQVVICSGSQQALYLTLQLLLNPGDEILVEQPGYYGIDGAIVACGGRKVPVFADQKGFNLSAGLARAPNARCVLLTPSRNYPMGYTLDLERRLSLLQWARSEGAWVIEDDYDSEFRFDGPPLTSLQGLGGQKNVIYIGTFSRILHPSIRLGYMVLPEGLLEACRVARAYLDGGLSLLPQLALNEFMARGHFASHVRRMRKLYKHRRDTLAQLVEQMFEGRLPPVSSDGGMHSVFLLPHCYDDVALCAQTTKRGLGIRPLSQYYSAEPARGGLVMGFAAYSRWQMQAALTRLQSVL